MGYEVPAAPRDAWRTYDPSGPNPGYFEFDWLSARHPDLYDTFALHTDAVMAGFRTFIDLADRTVCDVAAGTGRSTRAAALDAEHVISVDVYRSTIEFAVEAAARAGLTNVWHAQADRSRLPLPNNAVD